MNNAKELDPTHLPASLLEVPISEAVRALDMLTKEELERERYEAREKAKRDHLSREKAQQRAQQEVQRAQQEVQRAQQESEHWQQQAAISREAGILIGQIQLCQQMLQQAVTPQEELQDKPLDELRQLAKELRQKLVG